MYPPEKKEATTMKVIPDDSGKIKVMLTREDMAELGFSLNTIDCSDPETRLLLRAVYRLAAIKVQRAANESRLLIEAYPHIDGGGILYFTPLKEKSTRKRLRLKKPPQKSGSLNYVFGEGGELLRAIDMLYRNPLSQNLPSEVYYIDGFFLLTVYAPPILSVLHEIKEFSGDFFTGDRMEKHTREHGKALTGKNAILEIGSKISQGSLMN